VCAACGCACVRGSEVVLKVPSHGAPSLSRYLPSSRLSCPPHSFPQPARSDKRRGTVLSLPLQNTRQSTSSIAADRCSVASRGQLATERSGRPSDTSIRSPWPRLDPCTLLRRLCSCRCLTSPLLVVPIDSIEGGEKLPSTAGERKLAIWFGLACLSVGHDKGCLPEHPLDARL
jgi:hypothetical protein